MEGNRTKPGCRSVRAAGDRVGNLRPGSSVLGTTDMTSLSQISLYDISNHTILPQMTYRKMTEDPLSPLLFCINFYLSTVHRVARVRSLKQLNAFRVCFGVFCCTAE